MIRVSVLGYGKVGKHLCRALDRAEGISLEGIYSRSFTPSESDVRKTDDIGRIPESDVLIVCVSDDAIGKISPRVEGWSRQPLVVHTSGVASYRAIGDEYRRRGVLYPLMSFSDGVEVDWERVPLLCQTEREEDEVLLLDLAGRLCGDVRRMDEETRSRVHVAAVLASNFTNHLLTLSDDFCRNNGLDFAMFSPLVEATVKKALACGPFVSQTGPALRGDGTTLFRHRQILAGEEDLRKIYDLLSDSIQKRHGTEH